MYLLEQGRHNKILTLHIREDIMSQVIATFANFHLKCQVLPIGKHQEEIKKKANVETNPNKFLIFPIKIGWICDLIFNKEILNVVNS